MKITNASEIKRDEKFKILIYGKPGAGKTSTVKNLKGKTLVLDIDGTSQVLSGCENIDVAKIEENKPEDSIKEFGKFAKEQVKKGTYQNVVIDNISYFQELWFTHEAKRTSRSSVEMSEYGRYLDIFQRLIKAFKTLDCNVVFTAWETQREIRDEAQLKVFNQFYPDVREKAINSLLGTLPVVARITSKVDVETGEIIRGAILHESNEVYAKNQIDNRKGCRLENLFEFEEV